MDIKEAIKNIVSRPFEIETVFYEIKIHSILSVHLRDKNLKQLKVTNKNVIDTIKSHIPEAIVSDFGYYYCLIKLENIDFLISKSGRKKYIRVKGKIDYYINSIPNLVEYMQDINRLMPEWEKEFAEMLVQYANEIKKMERKSVLEGTEIRYILSNRIRLHLGGCRENVEGASILRKALSETGKSFENISVQSVGEWFKIIINAMDSAETYFQNVEINSEQLEKIDKMIPAWIEELSQWNYEYEKEKKAKDLSKLSLNTLIKQKMKSLGCEYYIRENNKTMTLFIKLEKTRMLKLSLPYKSMGVIGERLDMIEDTIKAINNIHNAFRIINEERGINWERETQQ
ncbi:MAG: hypothetical protein IK025_00915 [Bacteroidales bacterium]|nr:hypothetical protein [Bacteroidales bacterium]